jgi:hypothetical protein
VPTRRRKRQRLGTSTTPADRLAAEHPDHVWALDYQFDQTQDGRILKLLNVVDEHTREAMAIEVDRRIDADATVAMLDRLVAEHGRSPRFIRCDNGPELTANALRDWCRFHRHGCELHRAGLTLAEPVCGELRQPAPRRTARRQSLQHPARSSSVGRGLADRVQHRPAPQRHRLPDPDPLRPDLDQPPPHTLIASGPTTGVPSLALARSATPPWSWTTSTPSGWPTWWSTRPAAGPNR